MVELDKTYEIMVKKRGRKRSTRMKFKVVGFYDSPSRGRCAEVVNDSGRHVLPLEEIKDATEVKERAK